MNRPIDAAAQIGFLRKLQRLVDEGSFTATYKFALLHAIADLCVESRIIPGEPLPIRIGKLAEKFIGYYWHQVLPYRPTGRGGGILARNSGSPATILRAVHETQAVYGAHSPAVVRNTGAWGKMVTCVAGTI